MAGRMQLAALALLAMGLSPAYADDSAQCEAPAAEAPSHPITMTPRLGLSFYQDGQEQR